MSTGFCVLNSGSHEHRANTLLTELFPQAPCFQPLRVIAFLKPNTNTAFRTTASYGLGFLLSCSIMSQLVRPVVLICPGLGSSLECGTLSAPKRMAGWNPCSIQTPSMRTCALIAVVRALSTCFVQITDDVWPKSQTLCSTPGCSQVPLF